MFFEVVVVYWISHFRDTTRTRSAKIGNARNSIVLCIVLHRILKRIPSQSALMLKDSYYSLSLAATPFFSGRTSLPFSLHYFLGFSERRFPSFISNHSGWSFSPDAGPAFSLQRVCPRSPYDRLQLVLWYRLLSHLIIYTKAHTYMLYYPIFPLS